MVARHPPPQVPAAATTPARASVRPAAAQASRFVHGRAELVHALCDEPRHCRALPARALTGARSNHGYRDRRRRQVAAEQVGSEDNQLVDAAAKGDVDLGRLLISFLQTFAHTEELCLECPLRRRLGGEHGHDLGLQVTHAVRRNQWALCPMAWRAHDSGNPWCMPVHPAVRLAGARSTRVTRGPLARATSPRAARFGRCTYNGCKAHG